MTLSDPLVKRVAELAEREGRTPEEMLQTLIDAYEHSHAVVQQHERDPIEDFIGAFDDDVTDLSVTVRETLRRKFASDDDRTA